jgi:hypothetical protein
MKSLILLIFTVVFFITICFSQSSDKSAHPQLTSLTSKDMIELNSLPELHLPAAYKNKSIPHEVDNTLQIYYSGLFLQSGLSCGQAACVANGFTYEINRLRNLDGTLVQNKYTTHFNYNWENRGEGWGGASYYHSLIVLKVIGNPNMQVYGGTHDYGGLSRFLHGYDSYYEAMHNRIRAAYAINCSTEEGILTLKNWLNDHLDGSDVGGIGFFYSQHQIPTTLLPAGTEHAGEKVCITWVTGSNHAMTITGYNDSIRWDYNGDGIYTNNLDITDDGVVDVRDWEIGGFKMCDTYLSPFNGWMMYRSLALSPSGGGIWNNTVNVLYAIKEYSPELTYKINLYYTNRNRIKILAGMSTNLEATEPDYYMTFPIFDYQGGEWGMQGGNDEASRQIEFGLDVTPFLNLVPTGTPVKLFFLIHENDNDGWGFGKINSFSAIDYTSGSAIEYASPQINVPIIQNGVTSVSVNHTLNFSKPSITANALPTASVNQDYSYQFVASDGTEPYRWELDHNYSMAVVTTPLTEATTPLVGPYISLPFEFPFFGESFSHFYLSNDGLIDFSGESYVLPYNYYAASNTAVTFQHRKCIAAFYSKTNCLTYYSSGSDYYIIRWVATNIDVSLRLESNGNITIYYNNCSPPNSLVWTSGFSFGNLSNCSITPVSGAVTDIASLGYKYYPRPVSEIFSISENGLLTGKPIECLWACPLVVKVTDAKGLSYSKLFQLSTENKIVSEEEMNFLEVYPNPVIDKVGILVTTPDNDIAKIKIYTNDGRLLHDFFVNTNSLTIIDFEIFPTGNYLFVAESDNFKYSRKLIKN